MIKMIAAVDRNNGIGLNGKLPFNQKTDMLHFKETTMGHACIMGRKTYDSLPRPLEGRLNIVLTKNKLRLRSDIVVQVGCIDEAIEEGKKFSEHQYVIGGGEIYGQFIDKAGVLKVTKVQTSLAKVDAWFPEIKVTDWKRIRAVNHLADDHNDFNSTFEEYVRY